MNAKHLLVIEDDKDIAALIRHVGEAEGFVTQVACNEDAIKCACDNSSPDVIALDLHMPDLDGFEVLKLLQGHGCSASIIVISGGEKHLLKQAVELGSLGGLNVAGNLSKPFRIAELRAALVDIKHGLPE